MPIFDTFLGVFSVVNGLALLRVTDSQWRDFMRQQEGEAGLSRGAVVFFLWSAATLAAGGAVRGLSMVDQCKRAKYQLKLRAQKEAAPPEVPAVDTPDGSTLDPAAPTKGEVEGVMP